MFNPFVLYETKYLYGFRKKGVKAFVKQTYDRGRNWLDDDSLPSFLLSHYEDIAMARIHFDILADDPHKRLLLLDDPGDWAELKQMGRPDSGMYVYMKLTHQNVDQIAKKLLDKKLHAYIDYKLCWRIPNHDTVLFSVEVIFGELYVFLRHQKKYHYTKIDDIETTSGYVL